MRHDLQTTDICDQAAWRWSSATSHLNSSDLTLHCVCPRVSIWKQQLSLSLTSRHADKESHDAFTS